MFFQKFTLIGELSLVKYDSYEEDSIKNSIRHRFAVDLLRYIIPNDLIGDWGALGE
jgi:hypothetical protein